MNVETVPMERAKWSYTCFPLERGVHAPLFLLMEYHVMEVAWECELTGETQRYQILEHIKRTREEGPLCWAWDCMTGNVALLRPDVDPFQ